jgi:hypothetical protein
MICFGFELICKFEEWLFVDSDGTARGTVIFFIPHLRSFIAVLTKVIKSPAGLNITLYTAGKIKVSSCFTRKVIANWDKTKKTGELVSEFKFLSIYFQSQSEKKSQFRLPNCLNGKKQLFFLRPGLPFGLIWLSLKQFSGKKWFGHLAFFNLEENSIFLCLFWLNFKKK